MNWTNASRRVFEQASGFGTQIIKCGSDPLEAGQLAGPSKLARANILDAVTLMKVCSH